MKIKDLKNDLHASKKLGVVSFASILGAILFFIMSGEMVKGKPMIDVMGIHIVHGISYISIIFLTIIFLVSIIYFLYCKLKISSVENNKGQ